MTIEVRSFAQWFFEDGPWYIFAPAVLLYMISGVVLFTSWLGLVIYAFWFGPLFGIAVFAIPFIATGLAARHAYKKDNS